MPEVYNANPTVFSTAKASKSQQKFRSIWMDNQLTSKADDLNEDTGAEDIDSDEIFGTCYSHYSSAYRSSAKTFLDHIRSISDPEHPLSLEQLAVVSAPQVQVDGNNVLVEFTPTVPHCGASTLIGALSLEDTDEVETVIKTEHRAFDTCKANAHTPATFQSRFTSETRFP